MKNETSLCGHEMRGGCRLFALSKQEAVRCAQKAVGVWQTGMGWWICVWGNASHSGATWRCGWQLQGEPTGETLSTVRTNCFQGLELLLHSGLCKQWFYIKC